MQFSTTHSGIQSYYCTAINATTDSLTLSGGTITVGKIYKVFITKYVLDLPIEIETEKIYFLRISSSVIKIYLTLATAKTQTSPINFATSASGTLFIVYFPEKKYAPLTEAISTAAEPDHIYCCPPVEPRKTTDLIDTATITFLGTTVTLKMKFWNVDTYNWDFRRLAYLTAPEVTIGSYHYKFEMYFYNGPYPNYSEDYTQCRMSVASNDPAWNGWFPAVTETGTTSFLNAAFPMSGNLEGERYVGTYPSGSSVATSIPVVFSGNQTLPDQLRFYMVDAYLERKERDLTDPIVPEGIQNKVELGTIDVLLTYDTDACMYISDVLNYYEIPGRLVYAPDKNPGGSAYGIIDYPTITSGKKFISYLGQRDQYISVLGTAGQDGYGGLAPLDRWSAWINGSYSFSYRDFMLSQDDSGGFTDFWLGNNHSFSTHFTGGSPLFTGLPDGAVFMDSRFQYTYGTVGRGWNMNGVPQKYILFYAMQKSARKPTPYGAPILYGQNTSTEGTRNIYKNNYYYIVSDSAESYITSFITTPPPS